MPEADTAAETGAETGAEAAAAEAGEPRDIETAGESDTIIDSGRVSHDQSVDGGSQRE